MRAIRNVTVFLLVAFLLSPVAAQDKSAITVFVTKTGEKYHRDGCQHLRQSKIAKELDEAVAAGYTACGRCKPPRSSATREEKDRPSARVSSQCAATTKKGTRCSRKASAGSAHCWQHQR